jgi:hypothetical protein
MNADPRSPNSCRAFEQALQDLLDGAGELTAEAQAHRAACSTCAANERAARVLQRSMRAQPSIVPPAGWTDRLVSAVLADVETKPAGRRSSARFVVLLAIAASLLLALAVWSRLGRAPVTSSIPPAPGPEMLAGKTGPAPISVEASLEEAGDALAALTRRTTERTLEPALNLRAGSAGAPTLSIPDPLPDAMEPAAQSLAEVRLGASSGLSPMARTARRAFAMFLRDIPVQTDEKPDN